MTDLWQSFATAAPDLLRTMARHEAQTTIFILVLLVVDSLLKRPSPRFRYALWLVALAKTLWPPFLSLPALDFASRQPVVTDSLAPIAPLFEAPVIQTPLTEVLVTQAPLMEMPATQTPVSIAPLTEASAPVLTWGAVFLGVWVAIALVVVTLMIVNYVRFRLRLRPPRAEPYHFEEQENAVDRPWPPIWATDRIPSPLTVGLVRPRIYLTWKIIASGAKALRATLYHELAHIIRRDGWITLLQAAALVIHPFNPLVWLMNARLSRYREQLCDNFALRHTGVAPGDYGNMLLDQLSQARAPLLAANTPAYFFETKRDLVHRLHQLMKRKGELMNRITSLQKIFLGGLLFGLLLIASQGAEQAVIAAPAPETSAADIAIEPENVEFFPGDQVYQLHPARQVTQIAGLKTLPTIWSIKHEGTSYYLQDIDNYRFLQLGADFELLDEIGPIRKGLFKYNDPKPSTVGMKDDSLFVHYSLIKEFRVFHNGEFIRSFPTPRNAMNHLVFTDDVIIYGIQIPRYQDNYSILFAGYDGTLPPGYPEGFGEWGGDLDFTRTPVDVFSDSRGDILAVPRSQPIVQRYSPDYELIETYDLRSFEFIETRWNESNRRMQLNLYDFYEDRLYIYCSKPGANDEQIPAVVMLDINPDGITPVGTLELAGPTEGEDLRARCLCVGPDKQLLVYDVATGSLLIYEVPL